MKVFFLGAYSEKGRAGMMDSSYDGQIFSKSMKSIIKNFVGTIPVQVTIYKIVSLQRANNKEKRNV